MALVRSRAVVSLAMVGVTGWWVGRGTSSDPAPSPIWWAGLGLIVIIAVAFGWTLHQHDTGTRSLSAAIPWQHLALATIGQRDRATRALNVAIPALHADGHRARPTPDAPAPHCSRCHGPCRYADVLAVDLALDDGYLTVAEPDLGPVELWPGTGLVLEMGGAR